MSNRTNIRFVILICLISVVSLLSAGCTTQQKTVELYVDAVQLVELNEKEKAIEKLDAAVELNERFSLAYSLLGQIYQEMKDYKKSAASYESATKLNPWSFEDFFDLGRVYHIMEKFAKAVKAYARACELQPDHLDAHIGAAKCYYEIKDYSNALGYGEQAERIDPDVSEIHKLLGDIHESQKDYEQAIRSYKRSLEINSNNHEIMTSLAIAYLKINYNEPAKELLKSVVQIQPGNSSIPYQYLGYCYLRFHDQYVKSYKQMLERDSENSEALTSLLEKANESLEKAMENYTRAIQINDKDWQAHRGLGVAYMLKAFAENKDGQLKKKAIQQWRQSLDINPDQPRRQRLLKLIKKYSN